MRDEAIGRLRERKGALGSRFKALQQRSQEMKILLFATGSLRTQLVTITICLR